MWQKLKGEPVSLEEKILHEQEGLYANPDSNPDIAPECPDINITEHETLTFSNDGSDCGFGMENEDSNDICHIDDTIYHQASDEDEDESHHFQLIYNFKHKMCWEYKHCYLCLYVLISILLLSAMIAFIIVIMLVVLPYMEAAKFKSSHCEVVSTSQHISERPCPCGEGCNSHYSCMLVHVQYLDDLSVWYNASMYEDELQLDKMCSVYLSCKLSHTETLEQLKLYMGKYGSVGGSYECYYNPYNHNQVIRTKHFKIYHVIHGVVWSSLALLSSMTLLGVFILKREC